MFPKKLSIATVDSSDPNYVIKDYGYGKDYVKILHVRRNGSLHSVKELEVGTKLRNFDWHKDYLKGDNSDIVATDSQKNTVYLLAKKFGIKSPEEFAMLLCDHFLKKYNHVKDVAINIEEYQWDRMISDDNKSHNHAFVLKPEISRNCIVTQGREEAAPTVISGLDKLRVLKTTQSSFVNFVSDEYRSLPDQHDRIFR